MREPDRPRHGLLVWTTEDGSGPFLCGLAETVTRQLDTDLGQVARSPSDVTACVCMSVCAV